MAGYWRFSSKRLGLRILQKAARGTGGRVLRHREVASRREIGRKVRGKGHTILVRSDQQGLRENVSGTKRSSQPRQHFPNTPEGRKNAREFIKANLQKYGVFVQHLSKPRESVALHGRIFISPNGTIWVYAAKPADHTTFARWQHEKIARYKIGNKPERINAKKNGLNEKALGACRKIAENVFGEMKKIKLTGIGRTVFVVYKDRPDNPEFYDLLFIQGMKKPSSRIF